MSDFQTVAVSCLGGCSEDREKAFWQLWEQYRNYLDRCCLKWMGNPTDAEDALSRAMLKAWEKIRDCTVEIKNFKAWLTRLTHNLCVDIHRERNQGVKQCDLEAMAFEDAQELVSQEENPALVAMQQELENFFCLAIDELPPRLRETFILHFKEELAYKEIAEKLSISYDNVRKRISQARAILLSRFNQDFVGEDGSKSADLDELKSQVSPQSPKRRKSNNNAQPEAFSGETLALSHRLKAVQIVIDEEPQAPAMLSVPEIEAVVVDAQSDGEKIEEIQDVGHKSNRNQVYPRKYLLELTQVSQIHQLVGCVSSDLVKQRGILSTIRILEKNRKLPLEYFLLRWKVWADRGGWVALPSLNNRIDSS